MNKDIMGNLFPNEMKLVHEGKCPSCSMKVDEDDFWYEIDRIEYKISGLCKFCQDKLYDTPGLIN
jgi:hypothetical protein